VNVNVTFLGVGEAFDEDLVNNSHLIQSDINLLLDCGYSIPRHLWKHCSHQNFIDAIYLSHAHADHYMGLPILLARMWEEGRVAALKVMSQEVVLKKLQSLADHAYPGLLTKLSFPLELIPIEAGTTLHVSDLALEFAPSKHSISNFAVRVTCARRSVCYSGDGAVTEATRRLYKDADLLIHECYTLENESRTHASVKDVIKMCEEMHVKCLAVTHVQRTIRRDSDTLHEFIKKHAETVRVMVPDPLETFFLES
jgi:ribonuclease BN (tRNA processing enzyme)